MTSVMRLSGRATLPPARGSPPAWRHDNDSGDDRHRDPGGGLCPKGINAYQQINHPDRLTAPLLRRSRD
ncbi:hypothetical protein, partial [Streptomyces sp. NPDC002172]